MLISYFEQSAILHKGDVTQYITSDKKVLEIPVEDEERKYASMTPPGTVGGSSNQGKWRVCVCLKYIVASLK